MRTIGISMRAVPADRVALADRVAPAVREAPVDLADLVAPASPLGIPARRLIRSMRHARCLLMM